MAKRDDQFSVRNVARVNEFSLRDAARVVKRLASLEKAARRKIKDVLACLSAVYGSVGDIPPAMAMAAAARFVAKVSDESRGALRGEEQQWRAEEQKQQAQVAREMVALIRRLLRASGPVRNARL